MSLLHAARATDFHTSFVCLIRAWSMRTRDTAPCLLRSIGHCQPMFLVHVLVRYTRSIQTGFVRKVQPVVDPCDIRPLGHCQPMFFVHVVHFTEQFNHRLEQTQYLLFPRFCSNQRIVDGPYLRSSVCCLVPAHISQSPIWRPYVLLNCSLLASILGQ